MKLSELKIKLPPSKKPRDPNAETLAAKRNSGAMGQHRDKKRELELGKEKHKGRAYENTDEALGEAKKAKPNIPKMEFPGVKVSMLQSWQRSLPAAIKELGHDPEMQGYEDGSTVWSVAFPVDRKFDKEAFEDKLRDKLQFNGWMKVVYYDLVERD